mgnify:CR=1 FL=1
MSVGLLNFFINSTQESYLTLNPDITFFNAMYKAYTPFAIESVAVPPTNSRPVDNKSHNGFNTIFTYEVPTAGDLMSKIYVEIKLPQVQLTSNNDDTNTTNNKHRMITIMDNVSKVYAMVYSMVKIFCDSSNNHDIQKVINNIINFVTSNTYLETFYASLEICIKKKEISQKTKIDSLNIAKVINNTSFTKQQLLNATEQMLDTFVRLKQKFSKKKNITNTTTNIKPNIKFAWVKNVGYAIINSVIVYIGGQKIDEHTGVWLNVWHQLTRSLSTEYIFDEMIGNIKYLTKFNNKNKPSYVLRIPLEFWFCRYFASSLPLASLQHQTVRIELATSAFDNIFKIISCEENNNDINIDYADYTQNIELKTSIYPVLYIDYVYLCKSDRCEFVDEPQEYIIDQLQIYSEPTKTNDLAINLDYFVNPIKEFIWILQQDWNKYEEINSATLKLYDSSLVDNLNASYFNYVQPYQHHNSTPNVGIYNYSFSLYPEELQVSGSANFSVIMGSRLLIKRREEIKLEYKYRPKIIIFGRAINILRFVSGYCGLAFTYG